MHEIADSRDTNKDELSDDQENKILCYGWGTGVLKQTSIRLLWYPYFLPATAYIHNSW